jgi:hypothetical protein
MVRILSAKEFFDMPIDQCSAELEASFFSRLKMRNGTFKTTRSSRFSDMEERLAQVMRSKADAMHEVLDLAVSSGTTTVELAQFMQKIGLNPRIVATDLYVHGQIVDLGPGFRVLVDASGFPLQYEVFGKPIRSWTRRLDYFTLFAAPLAIARRATHNSVTKAINQRKAKAVTLVTRQSMGRAIEFVEQDIFSSKPEFERRFDFIRAANILNIDYFEEALLRQGLANIISYMRSPGSLLLVNRTAEKTNVNNGSLFELQISGYLKEILKIGIGSEIARLTDNIKKTA